MEIDLKRPLVFFDIESTGLNIARDGIIELCFVKVFPGGESRTKVWRIKPWDYDAKKQIHIDEQASEVNGIKDEDLLTCPIFLEVLPEVISWLEDSDLAGFNSTKFDLPMLAEEIQRARRYSLRRKNFYENKNDEEHLAKTKEMLRLIDSIDLHSCKMVDVQNIYHYMEPRNLRAAYRFYCGGKDFENAHTAEADTIATYEVLKAQLDRYAEPVDDRTEVLKNDVDALAKFCGKNKVVDFAGRLIIGENGEPTISFGKHKGKTAREVWEKEPAYFAWIEEGDFTLDTKACFARLKKQFQEERRQRPATEEERQALAAKFNGGKLF